jgi:predicted esterase YcpF (UPF0227 family)
MATVIYLHGFASVGESPKSQSLRDALSEHVVFAPDLPVNPNEVIQKVNDLVRNVESWPLVFVGTSLGGFWANYFSQKYDAPCVLVNPALTPSKTLYEWVGKSAKNYSTGQSVEVTLTDIEHFSNYEKEINRDQNGYLIHLFAAKDDEVISYLDVLTQIRYTNSTLVTEDGGHRFESHWSMVVDKVKELIKS